MAFANNLRNKVSTLDKPPVQAAISPLRPDLLSRKSPDFGIFGVLQFLCRPLPSDPAVVQHRHLIRDALRAGHVTGDDERRRAEFLNALQNHVVDDVAHDRIEARRRFVQEQDFGIRRNRARQTDTFLHPPDSSAG